MRESNEDRFGGIRTWIAGNWRIHVARSLTNDNAYVVTATYDGGHSGGACTYVWNVCKLGEAEFILNMDEAAAFAAAEFARRLERDAKLLREVGMQALSLAIQRDTE